jgi:hypothetical protein
MSDSEEIASLGQKFNAFVRWVVSMIVIIGGIAVGKAFLKSLDDDRVPLPDLPQPTRPAADGGPHRIKNTKPQSPDLDDPNDPFKDLRRYDP